MIVQALEAFIRVKRAALDPSLRPLSEKGDKHEHLDMPLRAFTTEGWRAVIRRMKQIDEGLDLALIPLRTEPLARWLAENVRLPEKGFKISSARAELVEYSVGDGKGFCHDMAVIANRAWFGDYFGNRSYGVDAEMGAVEAFETPVALDAERCIYQDAAGGIWMTKFLARDSMPPRFLRPAGSICAIPARARLWTNLGLPIFGEFFCHPTQPLHGPRASFGSPARVQKPLPAQSQDLALYRLSSFAPRRRHAHRKVRGGRRRLDQLRLLLQRPHPHASRCRGRRAAAATMTQGMWRDLKG